MSPEPLAQTHRFAYHHQTRRINIPIDSQNTMHFQKSRSHLFYFALLIVSLSTSFVTAQQAQAEIAKTNDKPIILVFGDSLSAAYGIDESDGWVNLLTQKLDSEGYSYQVINGSVSGETTDGGLARLPAMLAKYQPELVILELGGNDGLRGLPIKQMTANLEAMIEMISDQGAATLLTGIQIPPNYGPRYTQPFFDQYQELANKHEIELVPFLIDGIPQQPELMQADGIHPVAEAQPMVLNNVWPFLQPML